MALWGRWPQRPGSFLSPTRLMPRARFQTSSKVKATAPLERAAPPCAVQDTVLARVRQQPTGLGNLPHRPAASRGLPARAEDYQRERDSQCCPTTPALTRPALRTQAIASTFLIVSVVHGSAADRERPEAERANHPGGLSGGGFWGGFCGDHSGCVAGPPGGGAA